MEAKKPVHLKQCKANELLNNSGGDCPLLQNSRVFATARQEARDELIGIQNYPGDAITSTMSMMDEILSIREFSTVPFYVYYWTDNQMLLWNEAAEFGLAISIDASGSFVKIPIILEDNKSSDVFIYNIVINLENKIYSLCQCLSSTHTTHAIFSWLFFWIKCGATIPREVVSDCSCALLNVISLAFNGMYYKSYLEKCFNILNGELVSLPYCLIKRDRAHLIKNLCKLKCFENENWVKKDLYVRSVGFCLNLSDFKLLKDTITALFIICESQYIDEETACFKRKEWLMEKISTFDFDSYYKSDDIEDNNYKTKEDFSYYLNLEIECEDTSKLIMDFILEIHNKCVFTISSTGDTRCSLPNNYYLPQILNI